MALDPTLMNLTEKPLTSADYQKQQQTQINDQQTQESNRLKIANQKVDAGLQLLGMATDQASYDALKPQVAKYFGPQIADSLPPQYDPATIQKYGMQMMDMKDKLMLALQEREMGVKEMNANSYAASLANKGTSIFGSNPSISPPTAPTIDITGIPPVDATSLSDGAVDPMVASANAIAAQNKQLGGAPNPYQNPPQLGMQQGVNAAAPVTTDIGAGVPPDTLTSAKAVADGNIPLSVAVSRMNPNDKQKFNALVMRLNPQFNASNFEANKEFSYKKLGNQVRSFNVLNNHLGTLSGLASALGNGDVKLINSIANRYSQETGNPAVTNFDAAKRIVADEVSKAIIGGATALGDRESAEKSIMSAGSPAQLLGIINTFKTLSDGQLSGLKLQYMNSTNNSEDDWNKMIGAHGSIIDKAQDAHKDVDPSVWEYMTPAEKALFK